MLPIASKVATFYLEQYTPYLWKRCVCWSDKPQGKDDVSALSSVHRNAMFFIVANFLRIHIWDEIALLIKVPRKLRAKSSEIWKEI